MTNLHTAQTILSQLGGSRFLAMTGAKNLVGDVSSLTMDVPASLTKGRANKVRITLEANDTYALELIQYQPRKLSCRTLNAAAGVYADSLRTMFADLTGLAVSLGTMGAAA